MDSKEGLFVVSLTTVRMMLQFVIIIVLAMSEEVSSLLCLSHHPRTLRVIKNSLLLRAESERGVPQDSLFVSVVCDDVDLMDLDENEEEDPWEHVERVAITMPKSYANMIDSVMEVYEYAGVRFSERDAVWKVTSASGKYTALTGKVDGKQYPTDVFLSSESSPYPFDVPFNNDTAFLSDEDCSLYFEVRCPREIRHGNSGVIGGTLFFVRAMAGSPIAKAFLTAQITALRDNNPDSPLAEQIESILGVEQLQVA